MRGALSFNNAAEGVQHVMSRNDAKIDPIMGHNNLQILPNP